MKTGSKSKSTKQGERSNRLPVSVSTPLALLTDFGTSDYYVGAMKGVIVSINPAATILDITHDIPPQDIAAAAFILLSCYQNFPAGTVSVAVVDPGVGSSRRPIVVRASDRFFVGPDNGLFSYILDKEKDASVFQITASQYFRQPLSHTFHGRDIFAPVAAELSKGLSVEALGREIVDAVRLPSIELELGKKGRIIHIDRFGNCVTNIHPSRLNGSTELRVNGKKIKSLHTSYAAAGKGLFAIQGSAGFLEISVKNGSAAEVLKAKRGDQVEL